MAPSAPPRHARTGRPIDTDKLDRVVTAARQASDERAAGYREQALKLFPWVCGRCARHFDRGNLRELTVHHKDMNHDHNPPDGSNWELLCLYCHDNEHQRYEEHLAQSAGLKPNRAGGAAGSQTATQQTNNHQTTHNPFAGLADLLRKE